MSKKHAASTGQYDRDLKRHNREERITDIVEKKDKK